MKKNFIEKIDMDLIIDVEQTDNIINDLTNIIRVSQENAYKAINKCLIYRNWLIGYRIAVEELKGENRAEYGAKIIKNLSNELTEIYGEGFSKTNLYSFYSFYKMFPSLILNYKERSYSLLSWSHYRTLIQVKDKKARDWYETEAYNETWSVRTLQRNISSQYYYRLLKSQIKQDVIDEMKELTSNEKYSKLEFIKNPIIAEFLSLSNDSSYTESDLETCIINNLQKFLIELGKGYAFVSRQKHIQTEKQDYFIDLVFYNYYLRCFVLIDLKTSKVTQQDIGQMDMYVRMYDDLYKTENDEPTIGIVLCSDTDEDIARYSTLNNNEQLFATKYKLYLPSEEELREEIEIQKAIFSLQQNKD